LNMVDHVGPVRLRHLLDSFGAPEAILKASKSQLLAVHGIGHDTATAISNWETKTTQYRISSPKLNPCTNRCDESVICCGARGGLVGVPEPRTALCERSRLRSI